MPLPHTLAGDDGFIWDWISSVAAICIARLQQILLITSNYFLKNSEGKQIESDKLTLLQLHQVCSSIITCNVDKKISDIKKIIFFMYRNWRGHLPGHKALPPRHLAQHSHFKVTIGLCHQPPIEKPSILQLTWKEVLGQNTRDWERKPSAIPSAQICALSPRGTCITTACKARETKPLQEKNCNYFWLPDSKQPQHCWASTGGEEQLCVTNRGSAIGPASAQPPPGTDSLLLYCSEALKRPRRYCCYSWAAPQWPALVFPSLSSKPLKSSGLLAFSWENLSNT